MNNELYISPSKLQKNLILHQELLEDGPKKVKLGATTKWNNKQRKKTNL
jgi:hypothetical protein